jgi:hypothetical protein
MAEHWELNMITSRLGGTIKIVKAPKHLQEQGVTWLMALGVADPSDGRHAEIALDEADVADLWEVLNAIKGASDGD